MKPPVIALLGALVIVTGTRTVVAQVSRAGEPAIVAPLTGTGPVRWPAVAHDVAHGVYLAVSGAGAIQGQYFSSDGAALAAPFAVSDAGAYGQAPRVTYASGPGAFLVTWHETVGSTGTQIRGRLIRYAQPPLTGAFDVSPVGTNWEMGATAAYSPASDEFLVAWQNFSATSILAQRVAGGGAPRGTTIAIDTTGRYQRDPTVVHHPGTNTFFVAYGGCSGTDVCFLEARRVQAGTGALVGGAISLDNARAVYVPEAAYNEATRQILVVWYRRDAAASIQSRLLDGDGAIASAATLVTSVYGSYDATAVAYNRVSNTFLFVTHGSTHQDAAIELTSAGAPRTTDAVLFGVASGGNFNPRVAANSSRAEWLAVTAGAFTDLTTQRLTTATRDAPVSDAGPDAMLDAATDGPESRDVAASIDAPVRADVYARDVIARPDNGRDARVGPEDPSTSGCGCRVPRGDARHAGSELTPLLVLGAALSYRNRRSPARTRFGGRLRR